MGLVVVQGGKVLMEHYAPDHAKLTVAVGDIFGDQVGDLAVDRSGNSRWLH